MHRTAAALVAAVAVSCSSSIAPTNPYDPETPPEQQARAQVRGAILVPGGGPVAGATVLLRQDGRIARQGSTAADGSFLLDGVVPGRYVLELSPTGFIPLAMQLAARPGEDLQLGAIALTPAAAASAFEGVATLAGEADHGGTLVEAVGRAYTAITNSEGRFRLEVAEGTYTLRMSHDDHLTVMVQDVSVARGETRTLEPVSLAANPGTIAGHVDAELADGGFAPLAGVAVTLEGTSLTGFTNAAGDFTLTGVPPGSYVLRVFRDGYSEESVPVLDVDGGERRALSAPFALHLSRGGLSGAVRLADTADASGVVVEVAGTTRAAVTGSDGAYFFDELLEGTYALSAHRDGYARRDLGTWTVAAGAVTRVTSQVLTRLGGAVAVAEGAWVNTRAVHLTTAAGAGFYKASEDPALPGDWIALPAGGRIPFTLSDRDGEHVVRVVFSADGETAGTPTAATVILDRQRPASPSLVVGDGTGWSRAPGGIVSLALSAFDLPPVAGAAVSGVARMELSNDAAFGAPEARDFALTATWTLAAPAADGPKDVYVRFVDRAGNVSAVASARVTLDRRAPADPALALEGPPPSPPGRTTSPLVSARLVATDANGPLQVRLSNTPGFEGARYEPLSPTASWTLLPGDGPRTVHAQFMDPAGNESLAVPASITVDTSGPFDPAVTIVEDDARPADGYTNVLGVTVALSAGGDPTAAQVSEDARFATGVVAVPMGGLTPPVTASLLLGGSGPRTVYARFQDEVGNWSATASARITVDAIRPAPPTLSVRATLADGTPSSELAATHLVVLALSATDDAVELSTAQGADCEGPWTAWFPLAPTAVMLLDPGDGPKTLCVRTRDRAGNESLPDPQATASIELDTTPPTNPAFRDLTTTITNATSVTGTLVAAATDPDHDASHVEYQCRSGSGDAWEACAGAAPVFTFALRPNQANVVGVRARDRARNVSAGTLVSVVQDGVPPLPPTLTDVGTSAETITFEWQPGADADVDRYLVHYGSTAGESSGWGAAQGASPVSVPALGGPQVFALTGLDTGRMYYVAVEAVDRAGNHSGLSGERVAVPNRVNPRVVSSFGARGRRVTALADGGRTWVYVATNQGVVQLDATSTSTAPIAIGRANVPDVVPDAPPLAFRCSPGGAAGHCVILAGTTLEGSDPQREAYGRAQAQVIWFPLSGDATTPGVGVALAQLPARPLRLLAGTLGDRPTVFAIERSQVVAFDVSDVRLPRRRGAVALPFPVRRVAEAALDGERLLLYGPILDTSLPGWRLQQVTIAAAPELTMTAVDVGVLRDEAGEPLGVVADPAASLEGGVHVAYNRPNGSLDPMARIDLRLCRYAAGALSPSACVTLGAHPGRRPARAALRANGYVTVLASLDGPYYLYRARVSGALEPLSPAPFASSASSALVDAAAVLTPAGTTLERLFVLGKEGGGFVDRWTLDGAAAPAPAPPYRYALSDAFAEWDGFVYLANGASIETVDFANPLAPTTVSTTTRAGRIYRRLVVSAPYLFASADDGLDVFTIDGDGGVAFERALELPWPASGLVVHGGRLFASERERLRVWDLADLAASPRLYTAPDYISSLAVVSRTASASPTTVYVTLTNGTFLVLGLNGDALAPVGATTVPGVTTALHLSGPRAVASLGSAAIVDVRDPTAPRVLQSGLRIAGGRIQGGYLVGAASDGIVNGPAFLAYAGSGLVDGFAPYSRCDDASEIAHRSGSYLLPCGDNGLMLVSAADGRHTRLLGRYDLADRWRGAALVVDGKDSYFAGAAPARSTDPYLLYVADVEGSATGTVPVPTAAGTVTEPAAGGRVPVAGRYSQWMLGAEGLIWSFEHDEAATRASIVVYETASPRGAWPVRSSAELAGGAGFGAQPVAAGGVVWVGRGPPGPADVEAYDHRDPSVAPSTPVASRSLLPAPSGRVTALAVGRARVYAGLQEGVRPSIAVLDARDPFGGALPALTALPEATVPAATTNEVTGLTVAGRWLFYTYAHGWGAPMTFGLRVVRLGAERDGAGATLLGDLVARVPLANPTVSGDRLFVSSNLGVAVYDLDPLFREGRMPVLLQDQAAVEPSTAWSRVRMIIDGPFAYLSGGGYRVYDLR